MGVSLGIFIAGYPDKDQVMLQLRQERAKSDHLKGEFDARIKFMRSQLGQTRADLFIERASRIALEKSLSQLRGELSDTQEQLVFYEQLIPPAPSGVVGLRAIDLNLQDDAISFRVLLMRSGQSGSRFSGVLQFVATGSLEGFNDTQSLVLTQLRINQSGDQIESKQHTDTLAQPFGEGLRLDFDRFQRSEGVLGVPPGFVPKHVTVRVLKGSIVHASKRVDL